MRDPTRPADRSEAAPEQRRCACYARPSGYFCTAVDRIALPGGKLPGRPGARRVRSSSSLVQPIRTRAAASSSRKSVNRSRTWLPGTWRLSSSGVPRQPDDPGRAPRSGRRVDRLLRDTGVVRKTVTSSARTPRPRDVRSRLCRGPPRAIRGAPRRAQVARQPGHVSRQRPAGVVSGGQVVTTAVCGSSARRPGMRVAAG